MGEVLALFGLGFVVMVIVCVLVLILSIFSTFSVAGAVGVILSAGVVTVVSAALALGRG